MSNNSFAQIRLSFNHYDMLNKIIRYFLENKLVTSLILLLIVGWGIVTAPFGWEIGGLPSDPVPVDAIPDIGENQQIVFTQWLGRSPQDIEDQITYPLNDFIAGYTRSKIDQKLIHLWIFKYLHHFQ